MVAAQTSYASWGGLHMTPAASLLPLSRAELTLPAGPWLAYGNGRSYGDSCFPAAGTLIDMRQLNRILSFDQDSGIIHVEAGLMLGDLIRQIAPTGWFPAVVPGTQHVTIGGALANDIHGKNHHRQASFGAHVRRFTLHRSDGRVLSCSPNENSALFRASIGGMGLTGLISTIEMQLMRVPSPAVMQEAIPLANLGDFFTLAPIAEQCSSYVVAWLDSLATGRKLGRGVLFAGDHAAGEPSEPMSSARFAVPFTPPFSLINRSSLKLFNTAYRWRALAQRGPALVSASRFFFPLDGVGHWNRLYGPRGLRQHQSVIPLVKAEATIAAMLETTQQARHASFLTVLKLFGDQPSPGLLSFPRAGATLTLDFPYRGQATDHLLDRLDAMVLAVGGRINPYKDAHMSRETFHASFPQVEELKAQLDPAARSMFAERVGLV